MSELYILETNVDDRTPEVMGYTLEKLLEKGALDAFVIPAYGKKNRFVFILKVLCKKNRINTFIDIIEKETGTLGVRVIKCFRHVEGREIKTKNVKLKGRDFKVRVKSSKYAKKIEYEDLRAIAKELNMPLIQVKKEINRLI